MMQKHEKRLKPWLTGTLLRVLSESYPMNTDMTRFRCFSKNICLLALWPKVLIGLNCISLVFCLGFTGYNLPTHVWTNGASALEGLKSYMPIIGYILSWHRESPVFLNFTLENLWRTYILSNFISFHLFFYMEYRWVYIVVCYIYVIYVIYIIHMYIYILGISLLCTTS